LTPDTELPGEFNEELIDKLDNILH
jgi:hypothetical protein